MCFLMWRLHSLFLAVQSLKCSTNSWFSLFFWAPSKIALFSWMAFALDHASGIGQENLLRSCLVSPTEERFKDQCRLCYLQRLLFFPSVGTKWTFPPGSCRMIKENVTLTLMHMAWVKNKPFLVCYYCLLSLPILACPEWFIWLLQVI